MSERGWSDLHRRWARSRVPLRPHALVVAKIEELLYQRPGPRLLLGVTPELAALSPATVAIDWSAAMIAQVWPGNSVTRCAVRADWADMPFADGVFAAAMGDGPLNMTRWPGDYARIAERLRAVIRPGGRMVLRCFVSPDGKDRPEDVAAQVWSGAPMGFHAFKWRLAMAAMEGDSIPMRRLWETFERLFPDRARLAAATGWARETIDEMDDYAVSPLQKSFPTRRQLLESFPQGRIVETEGYEMADRCPLLVVDL